MRSEGPAVDSAYNVIQLHRTTVELLRSRQNGRSYDELIRDLIERAPRRRGICGVASPDGRWHCRLVVGHFIDHKTWGRAGSHEWRYA